MHEIIGRQNEIAKIRTYIDETRSVHIYGREGVGKTAILEHIYDNWNELHKPLIPIFCRSSRTLREILLQISLFLLNYFKRLQSTDKFREIKGIRYPSDIKKLSIRTLKNLVFSYISLGNFCIILDHLEYVTPKINSFLSVLYEKTLIITASRQSWEITDYKFKGKLSYCLYLVPKLRVMNLPRMDAYLLMEYLYESLHMGIPDRSQFFKEIFNITNGNPKIIIEIFDKACRPKYLKNQICDLKLIQIDREIEKVSIDDILLSHVLERNK
jgi:hypothetical protein